MQIAMSFIGVLSESAGATKALLQKVCHTETRQEMGLARDYLGLYRAPAASANMASAAAVYSRCFQLMIFARISTPPSGRVRSVRSEEWPTHRSSSANSCRPPPRNW